MATRRKQEAPKPATKPGVAKNTSAPTSETSAEVLAKGAEQSAPAATAQAVIDDTTRTQQTSVSPEGDKVQNVATSLVVSSKVEGFRRAGRAWSRTAETVSIDGFTSEQVTALLGEPMLDVVVVAG